MRQTLQNFNGLAQTSLRQQINCTVGCVFIYFANVSDKNTSAQILRRIWFSLKHGHTSKTAIKSCPFYLEMSGSWKHVSCGGLTSVTLWLLPDFSYLGSMIEALTQCALYKWQYFGQNMTDFSKQIKGKLKWLTALLDYLCVCGLILSQHVWKYVAYHNLWCKNEKRENEWRRFFSSHGNCWKILCWWWSNHSVLCLISSVEQGCKLWFSLNSISFSSWLRKAFLCAWLGKLNFPINSLVCMWDQKSI